MNNFIKKALSVLNFSKKDLSIENIKFEQEKSLNKVATILNSNNFKKKFGLIVIGKNSISKPNAFIKSLQSIIIQESPIVFVVTKNVAKNKFIKNIVKHKNITLISIENNINTSDMLKVGLNILASTYVSIFTTDDILQPRSYFKTIDNVINASNNETDIINLIDSTVTQNLQMERKNNPFIDSISGVIFNKNFLLNTITKFQEPQNYWIMHNIAEQHSATTETINLNILPYIILNPKILTIEDIGLFYKDTTAIVTKYIETGETEKIKRFINNFTLTVKYIISDFALSKFKINIFASLCAYTISLVSGVYEDKEYEHIKNKLSAIFLFGTHLNNDSIHTIHVNILSKIVQTDDKKISIVETKYIEDLRIHFLEYINKKFSVQYITKPQYYDYHFFNCMVIRSQIQDAKIVITSNALHKYITQGKTVLQLWHGLGMLKKVEIDKELYPIDYVVCSSEQCVIPWANAFNTEIKNVLPLGQVQTDILFDTDYINRMKTLIRKRYKISINKKIVFFAPTFRAGKPHYYNFGIDIEKLSHELEKNDLYIIAKKHHVFSHILKDKGIDTSGLTNSKNMHFIIDEHHSFFDILCAADVYMTDYSSGIFYAAILDKPLVLYAPDVDSYTNGPNGFIINYPDDIPAKFVNSVDIELLINAITTAYTLTKSEQYSQFKKIHTGACDGHSKERVLNFLYSITN